MSPNPVWKNGDGSVINTNSIKNTHTQLLPLFLIKFKKTMEGGDGDGGSRGSDGGCVKSGDNGVLWWTYEELPQLGQPSSRQCACLCATATIYHGNVIVLVMLPTQDRRSIRVP